VAPSASESEAVPDPEFESDVPSEEAPEPEAVPAEFGDPPPLVSAAHATAHPDDTATPTPNATANAPTRPTKRPTPTVIPQRLWLCSSL